jgi:hypothetical protein
MDLLLSVISLALAIYERMERAAEKRRELAEAEAYLPCDQLMWTPRGNETIAS